MKPIRAKTPKKTPLKHRLSEKESILVYCRIRPLNKHEQACVEPKDNKTVILYKIDEFQNIRPEKEYTFAHVFGKETTQKRIFDDVSLPLVKDLIHGSNGLLFTYGITSSGKTYTMTGTPEDGGLLPRSLDVIFNSIGEYQAEKFVFKSDKLNGFDVQTTSEALIEQQRESGIIGRTPKSKRRENINEWSQRMSDPRIIENVSSDMRYSVFISYVEIYNNYIYNLLEDESIDSKRKTYSSKMLREDSAHNMYVFGIDEKEVKTAEEALGLFSKGQLRRKVANTALNTESSRSHSVFTIRLVQAPLNSLGEEVLQDKNQITISQLSLVDLAGSERQLRTGCAGQKLREAGNINASLMSLRNCIQTLRDSQMLGNATKMVPYRDSKLTHLFKTFFEGEGKVRMVVCINPRVEDYEENIYVMRFAEVTQDVTTFRSTPLQIPTTPGLRSGRGNIYREAIQRAKEQGVSVTEILAPVTFNLPEFPVSLLEDEEALDNVIEFLDTYQMRRRSLIQDLERRQAEFRVQLIEVDKENIKLRTVNGVFEKDLKAREAQILLNERKFDLATDKINSAENRIHFLERRLFECEQELKEENEKVVKLNQEMQEMRMKMQERLAFEKDKMKRLMERRLAEKQAELEGKLCFNGEKFRLLREILNAGDWEYLIDFNAPTIPNIAVPSTGSSESSVPQTRSKRRSSLSEGSTTEVKMPKSRSALDVVTGTKKQRSSHSNGQSQNDFDSLFAKENRPPNSSQRSVAIANLRHRRSRSTSGEVWVEHKPVGNLELNTVLQPTMKKRKSVSKLKMKDVTGKDVSKYVLEHQEQDSQGEMETQLYKGDVIPSAGGGAQIVFNDVEKLRQESPPSSSYNLRKRSSDNLPLREIEDRCSVSVECHGLPSKILKRK